MLAVMAAKTTHEQVDVATILEHGHHLKVCQP